MDNKPALEYKGTQYVVVNRGDLSVKEADQLMKDFLDRVKIDRNYAVTLEVLAKDGSGMIIIRPQENFPVMHWGFEIKKGQSRNKITVAGTIHTDFTILGRDYRFEHENHFTRRY